MTQLLIDVPDPLADHLRRRAEAQGVTVSEYLAALLCRELSAEWPPGFFVAENLRLLARFFAPFCQCGI